MLPNNVSTKSQQTRRIHRYSIDYWTHTYTAWPDWLPLEYIFMSRPPNSTNWLAAPLIYPICSPISATNDIDAQHLLHKCIFYWSGWWWKKIDKLAFPLWFSLLNYLYIMKHFLMFIYLLHYVLLTNSPYVAAVKNQRVFVPVLFSATTINSYIPPQFQYSAT